MTGQSFTAHSLYDSRLSISQQVPLLRALFFFFPLLHRQQNKSQTLSR